MNRFELFLHTMQRERRKNNIKKEYNFNKGVRGKFYRKKKVQTVNLLEKMKNLLLVQKKKLRKKEDQ